MVSIGVAPDVLIHSVVAGCDVCGSVLPNVPVALAQQWLSAHRAPCLLAVDLTLNGHRDIWRRR